MAAHLRVEGMNQSRSLPRSELMTCWPTEADRHRIASLSLAVETATALCAT